MVSYCYENEALYWLIFECVMATVIQNFNDASKSIKVFDENNFDSSTRKLGGRMKRTEKGFKNVYIKRAKHYKEKRD